MVLRQEHGGSPPEAAQGSPALLGWGGEEQLPLGSKDLGLAGPPPRPRARGSSLGLSGSQDRGFPAGSSWVGFGLGEREGGSIVQSP